MTTQFSTTHRPERDGSEPQDNTTSASTRHSTPTTESVGNARTLSLRPVRTFALIALPLGWSILSIPLLLGLPIEPFALITTLFALLLPSLLIIRRESGGSGVRALLRDAIRLPRPLWWVLAAVTVVPTITWLVANALGGAEPLTTELMIGYSGYVVGVAVAASLVNVWEETAWTGFAQRRLMARWGVIRGSAATAALFAGIHLPLVFQGPITASSVLLGVAVLIGTAIGLRLIIGYLDGWTGGSLLTIGLLHASFNSTAVFVAPSYDWLRWAVTVAIGLTIALTAGRRRRQR